MSRRTTFPAASTTTGSARELVDGWEAQHRRTAASLWMYHIGVDLFSLIEHGHRGHRVRTVFGAVLARDVGLALALWRLKKAPRSLAVGASTVAGITDALAGVVLSKDIPQDVFFRDRVMSQFGLSPGWTLAMVSTRKRDRWLGFLLPTALQLWFARLWKLDRKATITYVARETTWSIGALLAVNGLIKYMSNAVEAGTAAASEIAVQRTIELRERASHLAGQALHDELLGDAGPFGIYSVLAYSAEGNLGRPLYVSALAEAELERLHTISGERRLTAESLVYRLLTARDPNAGTVDWVGDTNFDGLGHAKLSDEIVVADLAEKVASEAVGHLEITTAVEGSVLEVALEADELPQLNLPRVTWSEHDARVRVVAHFEFLKVAG